MDKKEIYKKKKAYELEIASYTGNDPLLLRYDFISWLDGNFGRDNVKDVIYPILEETIKSFRGVVKYQQDSRFIQLVITFANMQQNNSASEVYNKIYEEGIASESTFFYINWANSFAEKGNYKKADEIFKLGLNKVKKKMEIQSAYEQFLITLGQKFLQIYDNEHPCSKCSNVCQKTDVPSHSTGEVQNWEINSLKVGEVDNFTCPVAYHEPPDPNKRPMYPKKSVYTGTTEVSLEELRSIMYCLKLKEKEVSEKTIEEFQHNKLVPDENIQNKESKPCEPIKMKNDLIKKNDEKTNTTSNKSVSFNNPGEGNFNYTPLKMAECPKPLLFQESLLGPHTSYTAHMKEAMNVVQQMWSSPTPVANPLVDARTMNNVVEEPLPQPSTVDPTNNNENVPLAVPNSKKTLFSIYTEDVPDQENYAPTPSGGTNRPGVLLPKAVTSLKKDSIKKMRDTQSAASVLHPLSERKPSESVEPLENINKKQSTTFGVKQQLLFSNDVKLDECNNKGQSNNNLITSGKKHNGVGGNECGNFETKSQNLAGIGAKQQLPFCNAQKMNNQGEFLAVKLDEVNISGPVQPQIIVSGTVGAASSQQFRTTLVKPLLPPDEDDYSDLTCNTKAFNFPLPSSTPNHLKKFSVSRNNAEAQSEELTQPKSEMKNPGELSMILEASKEKYPSSCNSSNGCVIRGQQTPMPAHSVMINDKQCIPKSNQSFSTTPRTLYPKSKHSPRISTPFSSVKIVPKDFFPFETPGCRFNYEKNHVHSHNKLDPICEILSFEKLEQNLQNPSNILPDKQLNEITTSLVECSISKHELLLSHDLRDSNKLQNLRTYSRKLQNKRHRSMKLDLVNVCTKSKDSIDTFFKMDDTNSLSCGRVLRSRSKSLANLKPTNVTQEVKANKSIKIENNKSNFKKRNNALKLIEINDELISSDLNNKGEIYDFNEFLDSENKNITPFRTKNSVMDTNYETRKPKIRPRKNTIKNKENLIPLNDATFKSIENVGHVCKTKSNRNLKKKKCKKKEIGTKTFTLDSLSDINPFDTNLLENILNKINFPQSHHLENYYVLNNPMPHIGKTLKLANDVYQVLGEIGKGAYARIVKATVKNRTCALKIEKPPCKWEFYICREIQKRVEPKAKGLFMNVTNAFMFNGGSILETEWAQYGNLLNVSNQFKIATGRQFDSPLILHFASELINILDFLHQCKIIHADIKPDNFVVKSLPSMNENGTCLQLIDFGRSIDMELFSNGTKFTTVVKTEGFTCCEMKDRRPWTYQTDFFGLAGTLHCLITGEYMKVEKKSAEWKLSKPLPRSERRLWDPIFETLINIESCDKLPDYNVIRMLLTDGLSSSKDKVYSYRSLENVLRNK